MDLDGKGPKLPKVHYVVVETVGGSAGTGNGGQIAYGNGSGAGLLGETGSAGSAGSVQVQYTILYVQKVVTHFI